MARKTVVVIGSGLFGLSAANRLAKFENLDVKLVSVSKFTYFLIASVRAAVYNDTKGTVHPIKEVLSDNVELIVDEVTYFDESTVQFKNTSDLHFDSLVIATGAKWSDPISGTYAFKDDYKAYFDEQHAKIKKAKNFVLIGGGFNNVELLGELIDKYEKDFASGRRTVTLVHNNNLLFPDRDTYSVRLREDVTKYLSSNKNINIILNKRATAIENGTKVQIGDGEDKRVIDADFVIENTGEGHPSVPPNSFDDFTDEYGFIKIKNTFQTSSPKIFAIGDVSDFKYKGVVFRAKWLGNLVKNVVAIAEDPNVSSTKLANTERPKGNLPTIVSVGAKVGFGQLPLPLFGTIPLPNWFVVWFKSKDLGRSHSQKFFKS
jgi:NADH dehydrogenase FAD-containing subunit